MAGQAIPSYAPMQSARHFRKLECFCFDSRRWRRGETRRFPVVFFIDPDTAGGCRTITLSYTFFEVAGAVARCPGRQIPARRLTIERRTGASGNDQGGAQAERAVQPARRRELPAETMRAVAWSFFGVRASSRDMSRMRSS